MSAKVVNFYKQNEKYGLFSNFSSHSIFFEGTRWRTVEHCFQAKKFLDDNLIMKIQMVDTPFEAVVIGRDSTNPLRNDWEVIKDQIMFELVEAKVRQHPDVRKLLLSTDDLKIVEHTENDSYWGDAGDGSGQNKLGEIFMSIRRMLNNEDKLPKEKMLPPWIKFESIEYSSIGWRMGNPQSYLDKWHLWIQGLTRIELKNYILDNKAPDSWHKIYDEHE